MKDYTVLDLHEMLQSMLDEVDGEIEGIACCISKEKDGAQELHFKVYDGTNSVSIGCEYNKDFFAETELSQISKGLKEELTSIEDDITITTNRVLH